MRLAEKLFKLAQAYKNLYKDYEAYKILSLKDQEFFDNLFTLFIYYSPVLDWGNKMLAEEFEMTISSVEHTIRRLDKANLIHRTSIRMKIGSNEWTSSRNMQLSSPFYAYLKAMAFSNARYTKIQEKLMDFEVKWRKA